MTNFVPIVTLAGRAADQASKLPGGVAIQFANLLIGDGGGAPVTADETWVGLINQRASIAVTSVTVDPQDATKIWVYAETNAATPRGYTVREVALTLTTGVVYAVAAVPDTALPLASQGAVRYSKFRIPFIQTAQSGNVVVFENPGQFATQTWVNDRFEELEIPSVPAMATLNEHLAGALNTKTTNPSGVAAMIEAVRAALAATIPAVFTMTATAPVLWDGLNRVISLRAATKLLTGFGRAATDAEAASGVTDPQATYQTPWMTPEQVKSALTASAADTYQIGTTISLNIVYTGAAGPFVPADKINTIMTGAQISNLKYLATTMRFVGGGDLPGSWRIIAIDGGYAGSGAQPIFYGVTFKRIS